MKHADAVALLADAIPRRGGTWADLGAGDGTFTRALAELLGPDSRIYAVDRDPGAVRSLERLAAREAPTVVPGHADFTAPLDLPGLGDGALDGMLLANSLHFVRGAAEALTRLVRLLRPGGRLVVIEYDRRIPSPWVPHPVTPPRLAELAAAAGLSAPRITATRKSRYGGNMYVAALDRAG